MQTQSLHGGLIRLWAANAPVVAGVATFSLLDDDGNPLFRAIEGAFAHAEAAAGVMTDAPLTSLQPINANRRSIKVNCFKGTVLGIVGATLVPAPDGTVVYLLVIGA